MIRKLLPGTLLKYRFLEAQGITARDLSQLLVVIAEVQSKLYNSWAQDVYKVLYCSSLIEINIDLNALFVKNDSLFEIVRK